MDTPTLQQPDVIVPQMRVEEDHFEPCSCVSYLGGIGPERIGPTSCPHCGTTGFRLTKRIVRRIPEQSFEERAALAQIQTLQAVMLKGAATIEHAASLLDRAGKTKEAAETRQAAQAMRQSVEQG